METLIEEGFFLLVRIPLHSHELTVNAIQYHMNDQTNTYKACFGVKTRHKINGNRQGLV